MSEFNNTQNLDTEFPYSPPSMRCNPIIDYGNIQFHISKEVCPIELFEEPGWKFGIFNLKIRSEIPITKKHIHIFFTIDASGSMSETCTDGRTKMQHILYTLENMLRIFYEKPDCNISVHVQSFDTKIYECIEGNSNIKMENLEDLLEKIKQIRPGESTNIELALKSASETISIYKQNNNDNEIVHIFLTDGEITEGSRDYDELKELVPNNCTNIFIGYGRDHDSKLLSILGSGMSNEYRFVDALEKAGLVYGEIIHGILYKAIKDVTITTCGCDIYDYLTNTWVNEISIGNLLSEQKKTYHLRSKELESCCVTVLGRTIVKTRQFQVLNGTIEEQIVCHPTPALINSDLIKHMFRQRTQELLYESRKMSEKLKSPEFSFTPMKKSKEENKQNLEIKEMKTKLKEFHKLMITYMKEHELEKDPIMKMLCDDIYIANKTIGTRLGNMFTCARQTSQGRQQIYTCSAVKDDLNYLEESAKWYSNTRKMIRAQKLTSSRNYRLMSMDMDETIDDLTNSINNQENEEEEIDNGYQEEEEEEEEEENEIKDEEIDDYEIDTTNNLSPYISDTVMTVMREVSGMGLTK